MQKLNGTKRRAARTRFKLKKLANGTARLSVHRTPRHIYAQIISPDATILASASTVEKEVKQKLEK